MTTSAHDPKPSSVEATAAKSPATPGFRTLFEAEFSYVCHSLRRLGVRRNDLEDVAHDVFAAVARQLDAYDPARRPTAAWNAIG